MHVIDVNTAFGRHIEFDYDLSLGALLQSLDDHQIACALSYSLRGVSYDHRRGNTETMAAAHAYPQIIPVATLDLREYLGWEGDLDRCLKQGFGVFRFFPEAQGWSISSVFFRKILDRLRGTGICLVFTVGGLNADWRPIGEIARLTADCGLPVILTDTNYGNMAEVMAVMHEYPHLYAETNWLATVGGVEVMAGEVGVDRVLYGSSALMNPVQKSLNQVLETDLSDEDKAAILGGNAMRLLGISPEALAGRPELTNMEPRGFEEPIIDVHSHLGDWHFPIPIESYDSTQMRQRMKHFGITHTILSSYEGMRYDIEAANRDVAQAIEGHPELLGYVELNPHQLQRSCAQMDKYYQLPNFVGAELELIHTVHPTGSDEVRALMAEIAKRGRPVLFMPATRADARAERELGLQNPDLTIIHAHSMDGNWARVIADVPNICVEFCASKPSCRHIRECLAELGPQRLLFGTDQTFLSVGASVGLYLDAGLDLQQRRLILYENARRAFRL